MGTMMGALYDGKDTFHVTEMEKPKPGPGDAVVRPRGVGICGSDLLNYADKTEPETTPAGHEVAGEIVEVGEGVDASRVGERVAIDSVAHGRACTSCWYCRMGQYNHCPNRDEMRGGGFAEYMVRRAAGCYRLPENVSWEEGALVEPLAVSVHGARLGQLTGGETVVVLGAGNIGLTAVAAARALGAGKVFATARHEHQAALAKRLGADDAFPPDGPALQEAVEEATDGRGADMTIETVGGKSIETVQQAIEVTRHLGRIVGLGCFFTPITLDWLEPQLKEHQVVFSNCYSVLDGRHDYEIAIELMASGRAPVKQMVTHKVSLEEIQRGFDTAYDKTTGSVKVQIHS